MGCEPDPWAKQWLAEKRRTEPEKVKGWTIEKRGDTHYVKWGSTEWDKEAKKYRKKSKYIGILNPNGTVTEPRRREQPQDSGAVLETMDVKDFGDAVVLESASERIFGPLKECFPTMYRELLAMAELRLLGNPRLNHAADSWRLLDDTRGLRPRMSDEVLSDVLLAAGTAHQAQERFFSMLDEGEKHMAVDLSVIFSKSKGMRMLRKGYNRFALESTQFNLSAICNMVTGRPCRLCMVCGNVKENSVLGMLDEMCIEEHTVLVMDRGYANKNILKTLKDAGHDFVVAMKRNSKAYEGISTDEGHFIFEGRALNYGRGKFWGYNAYRFEDLSMRSSEIYDKYKAEEDKGREVNNLDRAGNIMILSTINMDPKEIYRLYKGRNAIENFFDTCKNDLDGDATYLQTDFHVMGYNFVTFLAFCIWWEIRFRLEEANLDSRFTPRDILRSFAAVKRCYTLRGPMTTKVPKDVATLCTKLGYEIPQRYIPQIS